MFCSKMLQDLMSVGRIIVVILTDGDIRRIVIRKVFVLLGVDFEIIFAVDGVSRLCWLRRMSCVMYGCTIG